MSGLPSGVNMASSSPPSRRASTGGQPPIKGRCYMVAEEAPSHDGTLSCTVYEVFQALVNPEPIERPKWGIQIYDTRSGSGTDMTQLKALARKIYEDTWDQRSGMGRETLDRIDLYGLAMPDDTLPAERAEWCKAHNMKEIMARNAAGKADYYIPRIERGHRALLVIDRPQEKWDEADEGGFLYVRWDWKPERELAAVLPQGRSEGNIEFWRYTYTDGVPGKLSDMRDGVEWLEESYVREGLLAEELELAVEKAGR
ncbi:hypothetical protein ACHAPJ_012494 [Fusarium lateritium]